MNGFVKQEIHFQHNPILNTNPIQFFSCSFCDEKFYFKSSFINHEKTNHNRFLNEQTVKEENRSSSPYSETIKRSSDFIEKKQSKQQKSFQLRNSLFGSSRGRFDCNKCKKYFFKRENL